MREPISHADRLALLRGQIALTEGDSMVARRHLATLEDVAIRDEIDAVIRAGLYDDAMHRLRCFTHPKFPSVDECEKHVGSARHFHKTKQGSLL